MAQDLLDPPIVVVRSEKRVTEEEALRRRNFCQSGNS
jgi:hypothetical protein